MPKICEFMDIQLFMEFDKSKSPHVLAKYEGDEAVIDINNFGVMSGVLPSKVLGFVVEWIAENQELLKEAWKQATSQGKITIKIPPPKGVKR